MKRVFLVASMTAHWGAVTAGTRGDHMHALSLTNSDSARPVVPAGRRHRRHPRGADVRRAQREKKRAAAIAASEVGNDELEDQPIPDLAALKRNAYVTYMAMVECGTKDPQCVYDVYWGTDVKAASVAWALHSSFGRDLKDRLLDEKIRMAISILDAHGWVEANLPPTPLRDPHVMGEQPRKASTIKAAHAVADHDSGGTELRQSEGDMEPDAAEIFVAERAQGGDAGSLVDSDSTPVSARVDEADSSHDLPGLDIPIPHVPDTGPAWQERLRQHHSSSNAAVLAGRQLLQWRIANEMILLAARPPSSSSSSQDLMAQLEILQEMKVAVRPAWFIDSPAAIKLYEQILTLAVDHPDSAVIWDAFKALVEKMRDAPLEVQVADLHAVLHADTVVDASACANC